MAASDSDGEARRLVDAISQRVENEDLSEWAPGLHERRKGLEELPPLRHHPSLDYLHRNWAVRDALPPASIRRAILQGPRSLVRAISQRAVAMALAPYLAAEQEVLANAVRLSDAIAKRCDLLIDEEREGLEDVRSDLLDLAAHVQASLDRLDRNIQRSRVSAGGT